MVLYFTLARSTGVFFPAVVVIIVVGGNDGPTSTFRHDNVIVDNLVTWEKPETKNKEKRDGETEQQNMNGKNIHR